MTFGETVEEKEFEEHCRVDRWWRKGGTLGAACALGLRSWDARVKKEEKKIDAGDVRGSR